MRSLRRASIEPYDPIDIYHPAMDEDVCHSTLIKNVILDLTHSTLNRAFQGKEEVCPLPQFPGTESHGFDCFRFCSVDLRHCALSNWI
jgi:hypothetical protein